MSYEVYEHICKERFNHLEKMQEEMAEDVTAIRQKVFNGFGTSIEELKAEMRALRWWIIGFMGTLSMAAIGAIAKLVFF